MTETPRLAAVPPTTRQQWAIDRRAALVQPIDNAPMRALASDVGLRVVNCPACRHNGYRDTHVTPWGEVEVRRAHPSAPNGERWLATFTDPNISWLELNASLTDAHVAIAFGENVRTVGITPDEREMMISLAMLDDACAFMAMFVDDPSTWGGDAA